MESSDLASGFAATGPGKKEIHPKAPDMGSYTGTEDTLPAHSVQRASTGAASQTEQQTSKMVEFFFTGPRRSGHTITSPQADHRAHIDNARILL